MKKSFGISVGVFAICFASAVSAQVKTQESTAGKAENVKVTRPLTTPQSPGNASFTQPSKIVSAQPANTTGSTQSQMPAVKVGGTKTYDGGAKTQPNRSAGVPSDKGRIVPREKLIDAK
jgi:hypothetical protein